MVSFFQPGHRFFEIVEHEEIIPFVDAYVFEEPQVRGDGIDNKGDFYRRFLQCSFTFYSLSVPGFVIGISPPFHFLIPKTGKRLPGFSNFFPTRG